MVYVKMVNAELEKNREGLYLLCQDKLTPQKHRKIIKKKMQARNVQRLKMLVGYTMLQVIGYLLSVAFKQSVLCTVCMYGWGIILGRSCSLRVLWG